MEDELSDILEDDPNLTQSQENIQFFDFDEQEDLEGCVARWCIKLGKELNMDVRDIDFFSCNKFMGKNKHTLTDWLLGAVDLVCRQRNQIDIMMETIEYFKREVIMVQGELLVHKDEELKLLRTEVGKTVKRRVLTPTGYQSYSAAVQKNSDTICISEKLKKATKSVAAEEDRSRNLIVYGLKEEKEEKLPDLVTAILEEIGEKPHFEAKRVGWKRPSTAVRPVKITVQNSTSVRQILMKAGKLRLVENRKDIWIRPDKSSVLSGQMRRGSIWSLT